MRHGAALALFGRRGGGQGAGGPIGGLAGAGLGPCLFDFLGKAGDQAVDAGGDFGDDGRVLRGGIVGFGGIVLDIVEFGMLQRQIDSAAGGRRAIREGVVAGDVELPLSQARALQVPAIEIEQGFAFQAGPCAGEQRPDIDAIDAVVRQRRRRSGAPRWALYRWCRRCRGRPLRAGCGRGSAPGTARARRLRRWSLCGRAD